MATFHPIETNSGITTTWVPLTTQLASATACYSAIYSQQGGGQLIAFDPFYYSIATTFTTECIPPEATEWWNQPHGSATVSSLGPITCPQAYTTAFNISAGVGSTRIGCCPSGYAFQGNSIDYGSVGQCASPLTPGQSYDFLTIFSSPGDWFLTSAAAGPSGSSVVALQINGWNFGAAAAASTTASSSPATSSSSSSAATTSPTSSAAPANTSALASNSSSTSSSSSGGLSAGASAGIGVGAAVVVFAALGLLAFIIFSRRRRRRLELERYPVDGPRHELPPGAHPSTDHYGVWSPDSSKGKAPVQTQVAELSTPRGLYELGDGGGGSGGGG